VMAFHWGRRDGLVWRANRFPHRKPTSTGRC
jgi:hypothetical protein